MPFVEVGHDCDNIEVLLLLEALDIIRLIVSDDYGKQCILRCGMTPRTRQHNVTITLNFGSFPTHAYATWIVHHPLVLSSMSLLIQNMESENITQDQSTQHYKTKVKKN